MCGTIGLFVGCTALSYCPLRLLTAQQPADAAPDGRREEDAPGDTDSGTGAGYRSAFQNWHERASVRQAPRRVVEPGESVGQFFSPDLVPVASHPLVRALDPAARDEILVQHLYQYLSFTAQLETLVVNRTVLGLAAGEVALELPEEMRFDAYKMYCDEAYHALFSVDLARQVRAATRIAPRLPDRAYFLRRLTQILADLPELHRPLAELLFVIVSETLISGSLLTVPDADEVVPAVRETIRDHAVDEGRHHAYFAALLRILWDRLDGAGRRQAGRLAPRLIDAFLSPDRDAARLGLSGYGLDREAVAEVVHDVYAPSRVAGHARAAARQTIRYFADLGAFEDPAAAAELHRYGLVEDPDSPVVAIAREGAPPSPSPTTPTAG